MGDAFSMKFDYSKFFGKLDELDKQVMSMLEAQVFLAAEKLRGDSVNIVPFDHGFDGGLASTASAEKATIENGGETVESVVGYNSVYAARLHEDMTLHIKQTHPGIGAPRQQKYLEKPAHENAEKYGRIILDGVHRVLNG